MKSLFASLHFLWLVTLLGAFSLGWGAWLIRRLQLPAALVLVAGFSVFAVGAYVVFFAYLWSHLLGFATAWLWGLVCFAMLLRQWRDPMGRALLRQGDAWVPGVLLCLLAGSYLALLAAGSQPPASRFTWELPVDDQIPKLFADRLARGKPPSPVVGDWLSSDRPPLQTALELTLRPWRWGNKALNYQYFGTLAQLLWLPALFALGRVAGLRAKPLAYVLLSCAASGFFLLNSVYVWPKLLAGALVLTTLAVVLAALRSERILPGHSMLAAACAALGMLAHGGVAFTLLALPAWSAARRFLARAGWRTLAGGLLAGVVLLGPWAAYQRYFDPPGNRLLKWHLAGQVEVDDRSFPATVRDAYRGLDVRGWWEGRRANLHVVLTWPVVAPDAPAAYVRRAQFFHLVPALDVLVLGVVALVAAGLRRQPPESPATHLRSLLGLAVAATAVWILLMFGPRMTLVHQGSSATTMLFFLVGAAALASWPGWLRWPVFAVHAALFGWAWIASTPSVGSAPILLPEAVISALLALAFLTALHRWARSAERDAEPAKAGTTARS